MAKRFFDTKLHRKPKFRSLRWPLREAFRVHCAECDEIGIWEIDMDALNFSLNLSPSDSPVTVDEMVQAFGFEVVQGDKLWNPKAVAFQFGDESGEISEDNALLPKILRMLKARGLPSPKLKPSKRGIKKSPIAHPQPTPPAPPEGVKEEEKEKEKEEEEEQEQEKEVTAKAASKKSKTAAEPLFDFESVYAHYPRKRGKDAGMKRLAERIRDPEAFQKFVGAVKRYARECQLERTEPRSILHWSSFVGTPGEREPWKDFVEAPKPAVSAAIIDQTSGGNVREPDSRSDDPVERSRKAAELRSQMSLIGNLRGERTGTS